jgi:hypothetical protein
VTFENPEKNTPVNQPRAPTLAMNWDCPECMNHGGIFADVEGKVEGVEMIDDTSLLV